MHRKICYLIFWRTHCPKTCTQICAVLDFALFVHWNILSPLHSLIPKLIIVITVHFRYHAVIFPRHSQMILNSSPVRAMHGVFLWGKRLIYVFPLLNICMQYRVILDSDISTMDCYHLLKRRWDIRIDKLLSLNYINKWIKHVKTMFIFYGVYCMVAFIHVIILT